MRTLKCFHFMFIFTVLILVGCSDQSHSPVSLEDQVSLEKKVTHNFTLMDFPIVPPQGGVITTTPGGNIQFKKVKVIESIIANDMNGNPDQFVTGQMEHYLSTLIDGETGNGHVHGTFTTFPSDKSAVGEDGKWVGNYVGDRSYNGKTFVDIPSFLPYPDGVYDNWTLKLNLVGHGNGGLINGWQMFSDNTLIIINFGNDPTNYPFPMPQFWFGNGSGFYKEN
ncbi:MAG: hypothetical protein WAR79_08875 [Melioribacteraceae bacterium]